MNQKLAAIIATLQETNGSPESMLYIFFDMNMNLWIQVRNALVADGLVTIKAHFVTLTPKGEALATKINSLLKK